MTISVINLPPVTWACLIDGFLQIVIILTHWLNNRDYYSCDSENASEIRKCKKKIWFDQIITGNKL